MYYWLKRVLAAAALASGAVIFMTGVASADSAVDPGSVTEQLQKATNNNETTQSADASAETNQTNVYLPVAVLSSNSNNGDVDQSNDADTSATAANNNGTDQSIQQDQRADSDGKESCAKCGSDGAVSQSQDADATAETNQVNVYAPIAVFSSNSNSGDVDQSNEADTSATAANNNATKQSIDQNQAVTHGDRDRGHCRKCGAGKTDSQTQTAVNDNDTDQDADATATTNQTNKAIGGGSDKKSDAPRKGDHYKEGHQPKKGDHHKGHEPKKGYRHDRGGHGDVNQSNDADTTAVAANNNGTSQTIDQDQKADGRDGGRYCKCGADGAVSQPQEAENNNSTYQDADATAETNQANVYAPIAVFSKKSNNGDVNQSNDADTTAVAAN